MTPLGLSHYQATITATIGLGLLVGFGGSQVAGEESHTALQGHAEAFAMPSVSGVLNLPLAAASERMPVVILVHDALGPDPRGEPYIEQMTAAGIAVLEMLGSEDREAPLNEVLDALADDHRLDASRMGVLGFGMGAAAATSRDSRLTARALLYPGCATLTDDVSHGSLPHGTKFLLMHGSADPANESEVCDHAATVLTRRGAVVRRIEYAAASYAWDRPGFGLEQRALLPAPGISQRVPSVPWPALTALSAAQVAGFFATTFIKRQP